MPSFEKLDLKRYGAAVVPVLFAIPLTFVIEPVFGGKAPLFFFVLAVILAGTYGTGPGLLATGLSIAAIVLLFRDIFTIFLVKYSVAAFAVLCVGASVILGRLYKAGNKLREAKEDLQKANERLLQRSEALARSNEELQRFTYTVAHDLNTPVRSLGTLTELLVKRTANTADESTLECARLIIDRAHRVQEMIRGLLDFARAVENRSEPALIDANRCVERALRDLESLIENRGAKISVESLPPVTAAENQLVQVFSNLIGNAIKYSRQGAAPEVRISATEQGGYCRFCVSDNGIGIDAKDNQDVFRLFERLHGEEYEGSGVGLALCKAVVERSGGKIWFESEPGRGTDFYFTLPR